MAGLAEIRNYDDLHAALRARADSLQVSRLNLDKLCGLPDGYVAKLLAPNPLKLVGHASLGALLEVMGCKLILEEDPAALARIKQRLAKRIERQVRPNGSIGQKNTRKMSSLVIHVAAAPWLFSRKNARKMSARVMLKTSAAARSIRARRAAIARWQKAG